MLEKFLTVYARVDKLHDGWVSASFGETCSYERNRFRKLNVSQARVKTNDRAEKNNEEHARAVWNRYLPREKGREREREGSLRNNV